MNSLPWVTRSSRFLQRWDGGKMRCGVMTSRTERCKQQRCTCRECCQFWSTLRWLGSQEVSNFKADTTTATATNAAAAAAADAAATDTTNITKTTTMHCDYRFDDHKCDAQASFSSSCRTTART